MESGRSRFLKVVGYLIPLVQSLPPLGVWTELMTLPFASYLIMIFANLPNHLPKALSEFFFPFLIPEKTLIVTGLLVFVYSVAYHRTKRKEGLVTSGPYRVVRHPQYFGIILITLGFTSWSVWILNNFFGVGFLTSTQTIGVWFIELFAYILLAYTEEKYLSRKYDEVFENYRRQVPSFIPFLKINNKSRKMNALISIVFLSIVMFGLIVVR